MHKKNLVRCLFCKICLQLIINEDSKIKYQWFFFENNYCRMDSNKLKIKHTINQQTRDWIELKLIVVLSHICSHLSELFIRLRIVERSHGKMNEVIIKKAVSVCEWRGIRKQQKKGEGVGV